MTKANQTRPDTGVCVCSMKQDRIENELSYYLRFCNLSFMSSLVGSITICIQSAEHLLVKEKRKSRGAPSLWRFPRFVVAVMPAHFMPHHCCIIPPVYLPSSQVCLLRQKQEQSEHNLKCTFPCLSPAPRCSWWSAVTRFMWLCCWWWGREGKNNSF